jgi:hypothetical protein
MDIHKQGRKNFTIHSLRTNMVCSWLYWMEGAGINGRKKRETQQPE